MAVTGALAGPQEALVVREEIKIVADVDPVFVRVTEDRFRGARCDIAEKQVELILRAIQSLDCYAATVRKPVYACEVYFVVFSGVHPLGVGNCVSADDRDDAYPHNRVRFACLRVAGVFGASCRRTHIHDWVAGYRAFVHFVICNLAGVGRPPVGRASVELFWVNPVEFSFEDLLAAAGGEGFYTAGGDIHYEKVGITRKADPFAVWGKFRIFDFLVAGEYRLRRHGLEIEQDQAITACEKQRTSVWGPQVIVRLYAT